MAASCVGPTGNLNIKAKRTLFHTYSTVLSGHVDYSSFYSPKSTQFRANLRAIPCELLRSGDHVSAHRHSCPFTCLLGLRTRQLTLQASFARLPNKGTESGTPAETRAGQQALAHFLLPFSNIHHRRPSGTRRDTIPCSAPVSTHRICSYYLSNPSSHVLAGRGRGKIVVPNRIVHFEHCKLCCRATSRAW